MLEIKQLTRLQIIRYCEKLEKENKTLKEENEKIKKVEIRSKEHWRDLYWEELEKNKKLKEELELYKKQYEHTMGEDS